MKEKKEYRKKEYRLTKNADGEWSFDKTYKEIETDFHEIIRDCSKLIIKAKEGTKEWSRIMDLYKDMCASAIESLSRIERLRKNPQILTSVTRV